MPRVPRPRPFLLLAIATLVACTSGPTDLCGCSVAPDAAVLYGRVTDAAGAPVQAARIVAQHGAPGCAQPLETLGEVTTGADGGYRAMLFVHSRQPGTGDCLRAVATPPVGTALRADTVPFAARFGRGNPLDSVRVDLVLRAP